MNAQEAWELVKFQLEREMPRAYYSAFLRDTRVLGIESGVVTIGAPNAHTCDWLEGRVTRTAERALSGILNASVRVVFEVAEENNTSESDGESEESFTAEVMDDTRYQDEVHPDRVVVLPGYALRLLMHGDLTPRQMSLWLGFRQAVYDRRVEKGIIKNISHREVCRFAMMSRASYWREISGKTDLAGGLVERLKTGAMGNANRYRVHMSPRLTRRDCAALEKILVAKASMATKREEAYRLVLDALNDLAARNPAEYLDIDAEPNTTWPRNVQEIVRRVLGIEGDMPHDLADAAERLTDHILFAFGNVVITHYFLREVVPALGLTHAQAWAIILLRDSCWYDYATRTQHDFAIVPGGLGTLARWVGTTRRSVETWINEPGFSTFVQRVSLEQLDLPDDWREKWHREGTTVFWVRQDEPLQSECEKVRQGKRKSETGVAKKRDRVSEKVRQGKRKSETGVAKKRDRVSEKVRQGKRKSETLLLTPINPINPYKPLESHPLTVLTVNHGENSNKRSNSNGWVGNRQGQGQGDAFWDFDALCLQNNVQPKSKHALLRKFGSSVEQLSCGFVSWLLYAYSPRDGKGVRDPTALVVRRLLSETHPGAGGDFDRLASLPPRHLRRLLEGEAWGEYARIFRAHLDGLSPEHRRDLCRRLFGGDQ